MGHFSWGLDFVHSNILQRHSGVCGAVLQEDTSVGKLWESCAHRPCPLGRESEEIWKGAWHQIEVVLLTCPHVKFYNYLVSHSEKLGGDSRVGNCSCATPRFKRRGVWMATWFPPGNMPAVSAVLLHSEVQTFCKRLLSSYQRHQKSSNTSISINPSKSFIRPWIRASESADPLQSCWLCYGGGKLQQKGEVGQMRMVELCKLCYFFGQGSSSVCSEYWLN